MNEPTPTESRPVATPEQVIEAVRRMQKTHDSLLGPSGDWSAAGDAYQAACELNLPLPGAPEQGEYRWESGVGCIGIADLYIGEECYGYICKGERPARFNATRLTPSDGYPVADECISLSAAKAALIAYVEEQRRK